MKQGEKRSTGNSNKSEVRKDRKSGSGMSGSPKKGGHGGKFTWSGEGQFSAYEMGMQKHPAAIDEKDPNFEDPDEDRIDCDASQKVENAN